MVEVRVFLQVEDRVENRVEAKIQEKNRKKVRGGTANVGVGSISSSNYLYLCIDL